MNRPCPRCLRHNALSLDARAKAWICLYPSCGYHCKDKTPLPKVVVEIRGGALVGVYADQEIDLVLVDWDEESHGASAEIVPDTIEAMPDDTRRLAIDAKERAR